MSVTIKQDSHWSPSTYVSWRGSSKETSIGVTCELPYAPAIENADCKNVKMLLNGFACYDQTDCPNNLLIIYS